MTVVTPLGTLLPQGVVVQIDTGEQRQYPFAWCSQVGCFARFGLARPSIDAMKRGKAGKLTLHAVAAPRAAGDAGAVADRLHRRLRRARRADGPRPRADGPGARAGRAGAGGSDPGAGGAAGAPAN